MPLTTQFLFYIYVSLKISHVNGGVVTQADRGNSSCCLPLLGYPNGSASQGKRILPMEL